MPGLLLLSRMRSGTDGDADVKRDAGGYGDA